MSLGRSRVAEIRLLRYGYAIAIAGRKRPELIKDDHGMLAAYEQTLKLTFGHIVELLAASAAWRQSGGPVEIARLEKAIDAAQAIEASRAEACKAHTFINDVCKDCGERDD